MELVNIITVLKKQKTIKEYYEQFYVNEFDILDEIDKLLETQKLPKLTQDEIENLNRH